MKGIELYPHGQPRIHAIADFGDITTCVKLDKLFARYADLENHAEEMDWCAAASRVADEARREYDAARAAALSAIDAEAQRDKPVRKTDLEMTQDAASNRWGY